jgi:multiple sugar transport system ATP-binding protein
MSRIQLRAISKVYPTGVVAVDDVNVDVDDGEVVVLLGPTGSGKSTLLRIIAGLEEPTRGEVSFDDEPVTETLVRDRGVAMVFQDYALYPHLTVAENIGFPLRFMEEPAREARVGEVMRLLALDAVPHRRPDQLSGGQRQRLAMARAIARPPRAFLLDQPMSSLDAATREEVRANVLDLVHGLGVATIYVTHDQVEALCMADRVAVMRSGRIEQIGPPEQVYSDPQRLFVAAFVGSPRMNLIQAAVYAETDVRTVIDLGTQTIAMPWEDPRAAALARYHTSRITVGIRPDALTLTTDAPHALHGLVRMVELRGHEVLVHLETGCAQTPHLLSHLDLPDVPGALVQAAGEPLPTHPMRQRLARLVPQGMLERHRREEPVRYAVQPAYDAEQDFARQALGDLSIRVSAALAPRVGELASVAVDLDRLYLFDGAGERIRLPQAAPGAGAIVDLPAA